MSKKYLLLSLGVFVLVLFHALNGSWYGDFWMHAAVVRELSHHPFNPQHPQLLAHAPHLFYSPYSLSLALIAKFFHWGPVKILSAAGIFNFLLLIIGLNWFVSLLIGDGAAFYTLLFTLLLWGNNAWNYSGFFHINVLGYVLPYPSGFAMGLGLITLSVAILFLKAAQYSKLLLVLLLSVIILLSHPLSAIFLFTGIVALGLGFQSPASTRDRALLLSIIPLSLLAALAWPYYPLLKFIFSNSFGLDTDNATMYHNVLFKMYPALLGLYPLLRRFTDNKKDPLVIMFILLAGVYGFGKISGHESYGRVMAGIVLILHMALAGWVTQIKNFKTNFYAWLVAAGLLFVMVHNNYTQLRGYWPGHKNNYSQYLFLSSYTGAYDVVLSDPKTSDIIPAFGGKIVANSSPQPFIDDYEQRQKDVGLFYSKESSQDMRQAILKKYGVGFLLIDKSDPTAQTLTTEVIRPLGQEIYADRNFTLIHINRD